MPAGWPNPPAEGAVIGPFDLGTYKKKKDDSKSLDELIIHDSRRANLRTRDPAVRRARSSEKRSILPAGWPTSRVIYFHPVDWQTRPWR